MHHAHHRFPFPILSLLLIATACGSPSGDRTETSSSDIVGGQLAYNEHPEVGMYSTDELYCTATLLDTRTVITAAHCVGYETRAYGNWGKFTIHKSTRADRVEQSFDYPVIQTRSWTGAGPVFFNHEDDIALLELGVDVPSSVALPARIPNAPPANGTTVTMYGYGCTDLGSGSGGGDKRKMTFRQGDAINWTCPGDSGGPTMNGYDVFQLTSGGHALGWYNVFAYPTKPGRPAEIAQQTTLYEDDRGSRWFPETKQRIRGEFQRYWEGHGGLPQQGFPITDMITEVSDLDHKPYLVQYFERSVMELHPENAGTPFVILLAQLGTMKFHTRHSDYRVPPTGQGVYFAETGHNLSGSFLEYWQSHGGLMQQGYPISEEFDEKSDADGKTYRVQYFERAVFEHHPENAGTPYEVLLSQLGRWQFARKHP